MADKDITLLIAHPDDEAIFLWPFLDRVKRIVCASNDRHNPERAFCRERGTCLTEVGALLGCKVTQFPYPSEFYRMGTRDGQLKSLAERLIDAIGEPKILATHNAWGEYGHIDHILCHHVARTLQVRTGCRFLCSDIAAEINWLPIEGYRMGEDEIGPQHQIDRPLFDRIKAIYDSRGCWTWAWEPVETCRVYSL
jgi:hypothetical protein